MIDDNVAILLTPPNIIIAVTIANIIPVTIGLILYCVFNDSAMVLDCTVLNTNANVTVINTAKTIPNHFWLSPLVMLYDGLSRNQPSLSGSLYTCAKVSLIMEFSDLFTEMIHIQYISYIHLYDITDVSH